MKIVLLITVLFIFLGSCSPVSTRDEPVVSSTLTKNLITVTPLTTEMQFATSYPPCAPFINSSTSTPDISMMDNFHRDLIDGLTLDEFHNIRDVPEDRGCRYAYRDRVHSSEIDLDNSFQVFLKRINEDRESVVVIKDNVKLFETEIRTYTYSGLFEAWGYNNHWVVEVMTDDGVDIIRDGESLKAINEYKQVFAFQLLNNKPFFFFQKKDDSYGVNYDDAEILLDYDEIPYDNPSPGLDRSVIHYQGMVLYRAGKDNVWRWVVVGMADRQ